MKCFACNYEKFDSGDELSSVGHQDFIYNKLYDYDAGEYVEIYACPKCRTVRL